MTNLTLNSVIVRETKWGCLFLANQSLGGIIKFDCLINFPYGIRRQQIETIRVSRVSFSVVIPYVCQRNFFLLKVISKNTDSKGYDLVFYDWTENK